MCLSVAVLLTVVAYLLGLLKLPAGIAAAVVPIVAMIGIGGRELLMSALKMLGWIKDPPSDQATTAVITAGDAVDKPS